MARSGPRDRGSRPTPGTSRPRGEVDDGGGSPGSKHFSTSMMICSERAPPHATRPTMFRSSTTEHPRRPPPLESPLSAERRSCALGSLAPSPPPPRRCSRAHPRPPSGAPLPRPRGAPRGPRRGVVVRAVRRADPLGHRLRALRVREVGVEAGALRPRRDDHVPRRRVPRGRAGHLPARHRGADRDAGVEPLLLHGGPGVDAQRGTSPAYVRLALTRLADKIGVSDADDYDARRVAEEEELAKLLEELERAPRNSDAKPRSGRRTPCRERSTKIIASRPRKKDRRRRTTRISRLRRAGLGLGARARRRSPRRHHHRLRSSHVRRPGARRARLRASPRVPQAPPRVVLASLTRDGAFTPSDAPRAEVAGPHPRGGRGARRARAPARAGRRRGVRGGQASEGRVSQGRKVATRRTAASVRRRGIARARLGFPSARFRPGLAAPPVFVRAATTGHRAGRVGDAVSPDGKRAARRLRRRGGSGCP